MRGHPEDRLGIMFTYLNDLFFFFNFNSWVITFKKNTTPLRILSPGSAWICSWCSHIFRRRLVLLACRESGRTEFPGEAPGWGWLSRLSCTGWILLDESPSAWWWAPARCSAGKTNWPRGRAWISIVCSNIIDKNLEIGCWIRHLSQLFSKRMSWWSNKSISLWNLRFKQPNKRVQCELAVPPPFYRSGTCERASARHHVLPDSCRVCFL